MGGRHSAWRPTPTIDQKLRQTILDTEHLIRNDELTRQALASNQVQLEYCDDGYPKPPNCLDRRPLPYFAQAA
jgi:hypothetical protein